MQNLLISRISRAATPMMVVCGLLILVGPVSAEPNDGPCTNRTLFGDYGFAVEGVVLSIPGVALPPGTALPLRGVTMTNFDGRGNLTQVDHIIVNGMPPPVEWTPGSGTYTVNPNCTGAAVINVPGNPLAPVKVHFVVVRQGKEVHFVVEANAVTSVGIKIE